MRDFEGERPAPLLNLARAAVPELGLRPQTGGKGKSDSDDKGEEPRERAA
jgi:hypothetical protein